MTAPPLETLSVSVRAVVIDQAARALGHMASAQIPARLRRVARFSPGKRARAGAASLARVLGEDPAFRATVALHLPTDFGRDDEDPVRRAARSYFTDAPSLPDDLLEAERLDEVAVLREEVATLTATVAELGAQLSARAAADAEDDRRPADSSEDLEAVRMHRDKLRRRLREMGTELRRVRDEAAKVRASLAQERDEAVADRDRAQQELAHWQQQARTAAEKVAAARAAVSQTEEDRRRISSAADRRVLLLLDSVAGAVAGLRREWRLASDGDVPADVIAHKLSSDGVTAAGISATARPLNADPHLLGQWLRLPEAHLIVDGYNVTKTGYPELSLERQRLRLQRSLASLAAQTGAEITLVFDGTTVAAPQPSVRGVRVLFSPHGTIADDVIRELAAAEPVGRVVVVVSSDREVADGVRGSGARTASAGALLACLA